MDSELLSDTFVDLADTLVADFDGVDFLYMLAERSVVLLGASAAGALLADPRGELRVAAASSQSAGLMEPFQVQNDQGRAWTAAAPAGLSPPLTSPGRASRGPVRRRGDAGRVPRGRGAADAAAGRGHRRPEPVPRRAAPGPLDPSHLRVGQASRTSRRSGCCRNAACAAARPPRSSCRPP